MTSRRVAVFLTAMLVCATTARAQSPNTAALVVVVADQSGAVVPGATIVAANLQAGVSRNAESGRDGAATFSALPITGSYRVTVSRQGFSADAVENVVLRAGETATVKVKRSGRPKGPAISS